MKIPVGYHVHKNGGGLVADTATVADTAYVGENARVSTMLRFSTMLGFYHRYLFREPNMH